MSDHHIDIRTELAASERTRVDIGQDGVLHVLAGPITLHLDRATCEELTTTLARAMVALARSRRPRLRLVPEPSEDGGGGQSTSVQASRADEPTASTAANERGTDNV